MTYEQIKFSRKDMEERYERGIIAEQNRILELIDNLIIKDKTEKYSKNDYWNESLRVLKERIKQLEEQGK